MFAPSNPARVYAGTGSGVYRSEDGGRSWSLAGLPGNAIDVLAVSPADANTLLAGQQNSLLRSEDGGGVWTRIGTVGLDGLPIDLVTFSPADPRIAYASNERAHYRSTDGGKTWQSVGNCWPPCGNKSLLFLHPTQPGTIFSTPRVGYGPLYRTDDGGTSWRYMCCYPGPLFAFIAPDPVDPDVLYGSTETGLLKSSDGGSSWAPLGTGIASKPGRVTVAPTSPRTLFVVGLDAAVYRSIDGGEQWDRLPDPPGLLVHELAVDPANARRVLAFGSGDHIAQSNDSGSTWTRSVVGLANVTALSALVTNSRWLIGLDVGVTSSVDEGATWNRESTGLPGGIAVNQLQPHPWKNASILALTPVGFYESDESLTWSPLPWTEKPTELARGPETPPRGYAWTPRTCGGVWTTGNGLDWAPMPPPRTKWPPSDCFTNYTMSVAADLASPGRVYISMYDTQTGVRWSEDSGLTWQPCETLEPTYLRATASPATLWAESRGGPHADIYRSVDQCASWQRLSAEALGSGPNLRSLLAHPSLPGVLFLGTTQGVVVTRDGGASWIPLVSDPGLVNVTALELTHDHRTLIAATAGQGVFTLDLEPVTLTTLSWSPQSPTWGQPVVLAAHVMRLNGDPASGSVSFLLDSTPIAGCSVLHLDADGAATCPAAVPHAGLYDLRVQYGGVPGLLEPSSAADLLWVRKAITVTKITSVSPAAANLLDRLTVTVQVGRSMPGVAPPPGEVIVNLGLGELCAARLTDGAGACETTVMYAGTRSVSASYPGDNDLEASMDSVEVFVRGAHGVDFAGVASWPGVNSTRWRSELVLHNPDPRSMALLYLTPRGGSAPVASRVVSFGMGELLRLPDIYAALQAPQGAGVLSVQRADALDPTGQQRGVRAWVRTYNQSSSGTFGQDVPARTAAEATAAGEVRLFPVRTSSAPPAGSRTNLLLQSFDASPITVNVTSGELSRTVSVPAGTYGQVNDVGTWLGLDPDTAVIRVSANGRWTGTVSLIDGMCGDPTTMEGLGTTPSAQPVLFPGVASTAGAGSTHWRSEAILHNPGTEPGSVTLEILDRGTTVVTGSQALELAPGEVLTIPDLYQALAAPAGTGMLRLTGTALAWVRTFNADGDMTFGQEVPGFTPDDPLCSYPARLLPVATPVQVSSHPRSNLLIVNHATEPITLTVTAGTRSRDYRVAAGAYAQINNVGTWLGLDAPGWSVVSLRADGCFSAYASTIDPRSGDPTTVMPLP
ncbi:MAG: YCF48-related protein [Thermoanaerobaculaceae bacterium]|jgi:photosystem II stability/assembly factor-like uncharacterized protein|nr:YCF48-related protein [Thermoanaerobaculaceae bacterium]